MYEEPPFSRDSHPTQSVVVVGPQNKRATWHTDPTCSALDRHRARGLIRYIQPAAGLEVDRWTSSHSAPCARCAQPEVIGYHLNQARIGGANSASSGPTGRYVLGCPAARFAADGSHARCPHCRRLASLAAERDLLTITGSSGYRLVVVALQAQGLWMFRHLYAVHEIPQGIGPLSAELLAAAWALHSYEGRNPGSAWELPTLRDPASGIRHPLQTLNFTAAALITADPHPDLRQ